ncbi:internal scaffolding protein [Microviridae sp.]|nr:internal scaffolding protein [Microviridae sp.]
MNVVRNKFGPFEPVQLDFSGSVDRAKQSMKDECDINLVLNRYAKTGLLTPVMKQPPVFLDVSEMGDYQAAMANVFRAKEMFLQLPAELRRRFSNDPSIFLDFCSDPDNLEELQDMGLVKAPEKAPEEPVTEDPPAADPPTQ